MEAVEVIDGADRRRFEDRALQSLEVKLALPFEHVVGDLLVWRERLAIDPRERRQLVPCCLPLAS